MDSSEEGLLKRPALEADVLSKLRLAIRNEDEALIRDGRLLPERELSELLNVSRRQVREALAVLEDEGMVFRYQGQGTFIEATFPKLQRLESLSNRCSPQDIVEVRLVFEPVLARLSAMRATPADIKVMKVLLQRGATADTVQQYERWDGALHAKIAETARNPILISIFELISAVRSEQSWLEARAKTFTGTSRDRLVEQHKAVVSHIEQREPELAEFAMREHIATVSQVLLGQIHAVPTT